MYTADVSPDRHYHLQSEDANRRIDALPGLSGLGLMRSALRKYAGDVLSAA